MSNTTSLNSIAFWRDINPYPSPLKAPTASSPHIVIIGGGVTGLVNAWVLLDRGYRVTVLSKEWASYGKSQRLTAQIAGALWEYPPAVCGAHTDAISLQHSKRWSMQAYHIWNAIASQPSLSTLAGVRMKPASFFFLAPLEQTPGQLSKMYELSSSGVRGFRRDPTIIAERRVDPAYGAVDAYEHLAPIIDTDTCMAFLMDLVVAKGAKLETRTIKGDLFDLEPALRDEYTADALINCTGLAGAEVAGDASCYPIRGALIRVRNDGKQFPKVEAALTITADPVHHPGEIVFLVPRNDDILLVGGITEPGADTLDLTLESPIIRRMRDRCNRFLPGLEKAELDEEYPLAQGLRPFRRRNVRVERELRVRTVEVGGWKGERREPSRIVHSYGHGGAGWSLSFGCAADVLALVEEALCGEWAKPMGAVKEEGSAARVGEIRARL
ncbi:nucleotide-binding domain-containing protein [Corynespora cassiicola Philippines]|uniref:Nucleotide-binding domain-containing protein n=1 Tax=Corynespora cassiicola Philippines TaxID=1448308 RepID=A0A2T2NYY6_CORCC|nr:nucleotide-binding domain-containing protein [Corynespora cassiicola Philippines]